ncbi:hypothetical protein [Lysobacter sp. CA199]|uniref:hypothetical protein n=1 Tax=Lysobacter sp. CA199 TaxID=3455608 RepID=UPI003F8D3473
MDVAAGVLMVRKASDKVTDFKGRSTGPMDNRGLAPRQIVAGNLKIADALQNRIAKTGYAATFD